MDISRLQKSCQALALALGVVLLGETAAACYLAYAQPVREDMVGDYIASTQTMARLDEELAAINAAEAEDAAPVEALLAIMEGRPQELDFLNVAIEGSQAEGNWITLKAQAKDNKAVQTYITNMGVKRAFGGIVMSQEAGNADGGQATLFTFSRNQKGQVAR